MNESVQRITLVDNGGAMVSSEGLFSTCMSLWGWKGVVLKSEYMKMQCYCWKKLNTFYHHNIDQLIFSFLWPECLTKTMEGKKGSAWLTVWLETADLAGQAPGRSMRPSVTLPLQSGSTAGHPGAPPSSLLFAQPGAYHWGGSFLFSYTFLETIPERHVRKCFHGDCKSP